jgi:hypothetical protein
VRIISLVEVFLVRVLEVLKSFFEDFSSIVIFKGFPSTFPYSDLRGGKEDDELLVETPRDPVDPLALSEFIFLTGNN